MKMTPPHAELWDLVEAVIIGRASEAQHEQLDAMIIENDDAARFYAAYMDLHATLAWRRRTRVQGLGFRVQGKPTPTLRPSPLRRGRSVWYAAAALLTLAITAWFLLSPEPRTLNPEPTTAQRVAMLTGADEARWSRDSMPARPGGELPTGPLELAAGRAQVMFHSGAVVDLTGPCRFEMIGHNHGRLTRGRIESYVPDTARGFTVDVPGGGQIVDLGTQFDLHVDPAGDSHVTVLEGIVRMQRIGRTTGLTLTAGQSAWFASADATMRRMNLTPIVTQRFDSDARLTWQAQTEDLTLTMRDGQMHARSQRDYYIAAQTFDTVTLHPGQRLIVQADIRRLDTDTPPVEGGIRLGLFDNPDPATIDNASGYNIRLNVGKPGGWMMREGPSKGMLSGSFTPGDKNLGTAAPFAGFNDTDWRHLEWRLRRTAAGLHLTLYIDGERMVESIDDAPLADPVRFNQLAIGGGVPHVDIALDNIVITHHSPATNQSE